MAPPIRTASRALFWDGSRGSAFHNRCNIEFSLPPRVAALDIEQVDYAPAVGQRMVLERGGDWRTLTAVEEVAIDAKLAEMSDRARAVWIS